MSENQLMVWQGGWIEGGIMPPEYAAKHVVVYIIYSVWQSCSPAGYV